MINVHCVNTDTTLSVEGGTTLKQICETLGDRLGFEPVIARVNNKTEDLGYEVYQPKQIEFLGYKSESTRRACVRSLCMMLYAALREEPGRTRLYVSHSLAHGYYCRFEGDMAVTPTNITRLLDRMRRMAAEDVPFVRHEEPTDSVIALFARQDLDDKVRLLESVGDLYTTYYTLGETADSYYGALVPSAGMTGAFDLIAYKDGALLLPYDIADPSRVTPPVKQDKMYEAFARHLRFNEVLGVGNVGQLNRAVTTRRAADLINVAEALHDKHIASIADEIARRYRQGGARVVLIAGPSSSGKTTTAKRLAIYLMTNLLKPRTISLDNYFVNRDRTPRDETGDYDFESLYSLDLEQFNADLNALIAGETVQMPSYNFERGEREYKGETLQLGEGTVLLIEGIHGLNPELTSHIEERMKYRVYVSALTSLALDDHNWVPTTDNRLLRRIIRDHKYRGTSALETLRRWPSVRRGEERWIFPYQENADSTFNSSLIFELGVMKDYADTLLRDIPNNVPQYAEAYRLRKFLHYFHSIAQTSIPPTSLLREFLGGSSFSY